MTSNNLAPNGEFALGHTNVSSPSIIHHRPSQQSITASEDYYSLSGSASTASTVHADDRRPSATAIHRFQTPPSRYRTPLQSRDQLPSQSRDNLPQQSNNLAASTQQYAVDGEGDQEVRKTPMRGEGKRRQSFPESSADEAPAPSTSAVGAAGALKEGGIRRKPVPSTVMEADSPESQGFIGTAEARSSVAQDIDREASPPTPGQDDTPYIRFALDQLTRDEEVRGSRTYPGDSNAPYQGSLQPVQAHEEQQPPHEAEPDYAGLGAAAAGATALGATTVAADYAFSHDNEAEQQALSQQWPDPSRRFDKPPRTARHVYHRSEEEPDLFIPVPNEGRHQAPLNFVPGILRPLPLVLFTLLVLAFLVCLLFCAIWSLVHNGLWNYDYFGGPRYFVFQYLFTLVGMLVFIWVVQIEVAIYRTAPFIAMASNSPRAREEGAQLPLYPKTFLLPYLGHFRARQAVVGFFMFVSWLQIWTIPLLASSFNVHFYGSGSSGQWRWTATAGLVWAAIGLYLLLAVAVVLLLIWLRRQETGLRWDPRSLADIVVLLERSNALSLTEDEQLRHDAPLLGYWRTSRRPNEVFQSYGVADKSARVYSLEGGRIREKAALPPEPKSRFSDPDLGREQRHSRENMLPKRLHDDEEGGTGGKALPWFLRPSAALLWIIAAVVLLLAFLIVSYLPSTRVSKGFKPLVPAPVSTLGYSGTNFLYSFIPALLAMICFLGFLDIDYAYRRLQPYTALLNDQGEHAERSLLLSYVADLPGFVTASALVNGHLRIAILSVATLIAAAVPVLGGGVFWAQFDVRTQSIIISADMPAYYVLSVVLALYASAFFLVYPSRKLRDLDRDLPFRNRAQTFHDLLRLVHRSKMLDDYAFHSPISKTDLVTRLLSAPPGSAGAGVSIGRQQEAAASKVSLADSVRGFGRARQQANVYGGAAGGFGAEEVPRYSLGRYHGRDGREYSGIDRVRS